jgi:hypothetical protein
VFDLSSSDGICERLRGEGTQYEGLVTSTGQLESIALIKVLELPNRPDGRGGGKMRFELERPVYEGEVRWQLPVAFLNSDHILDVRAYRVKWPLLHINGVE